MYRRPNTYDEGVQLLNNALDQSEKNNKREMFSIFWKAGECMVRGNWEKNMLRKLCETSEITSFLFKTAVPIVSKLLYEVDTFEDNIVKGLQDPSSMEHVKEMYSILEELVSSAKACKERNDIDDDLRACANETIELFNHTHVCEALRILCITQLETRLVLRIGVPRMIKSFREDKCIMNEKMDWSIVGGLIG